MTRSRLLHAVLAAGTVAGLTAGCSAADSSSGAAPSPNTVSVSPPDAAGVSVSPGTAAAASSAARAAGSPTLPGPTDATPVGTPSPAPGAPEGRCQASDLSLTLAVQRRSEGRLAVIVLTNSGTRSCRLKGFPGVDLIGPVDPTFGARYELPRSSATPGTVNLAPGDSAHAMIQFLAAQPGTGAWTPGKVLVTPPDTTSQLVAAWPPEVALQRQDGATHPVTFVGPMLPGAI